MPPGGEARDARGAREAAAQRLRPPARSEPLFETKSGVSSTFCLKKWRRDLILVLSLKRSETSEESSKDPARQFGDVGETGVRHMGERGWRRRIKQREKNKCLVLWVTNKSHILEY